MSDNGIYTKAAAELECLRLTEYEAPHDFCPLIRTVCRKHCVCIGAPFVVPSSSPKVFSVCGWHCCNPMLMGPDVL